MLSAALPSAKWLLRFGNQGSLRRLLLRGVPMHKCGQASKVEPESTKFATSKFTD